MLHQSIDQSMQSLTERTSNSQPVAAGLEAAYVNQELRHQRVQQLTDNVTGE